MLRSVYSRMLETKVENSDFLIPSVPLHPALNVNMAESEKLVFVWQVCEYLKRHHSETVEGKRKDNISEAITFCLYAI